MLFERPDSGERAVLVHIDFHHEIEREDPREFEELVLSAGGDPVAFIGGQRSSPSPRYFVGSGKLEEIRLQIEQHEAEVVLFNHALSPCLLSTSDAADEEDRVELECGPNE